MKRKFLALGLSFLLVVSVVSLVLIGCPPPVVEVEPPVTLVFGGDWIGKEKAFFLPVIEEFERRTGIGVEYKVLRSPDFAILLTPLLEIGEAPADVLITPWPHYIREMAAKGHIMEVGHLLDLAKYPKGFHDHVMVDGRIYGGAWTTGVKAGFWYRKSLFEKYGLTEPTTWEEFLELCEQIKALGLTPLMSSNGFGWPLSDVTEHFLHTFGGKELFEALVANEISWEDPAVRWIFEEKLIPTLEAGYWAEVVDWPACLHVWWEGETALLYYMGSWIVGMVEDPLDLDIFALPKGEATIRGPEFAFIPKYTEHPEEAKKLLEFLVSADAQRIHITFSVGKLATHADVVPADHPPEVAPVAELIEGKYALLDMDDIIGGEFQVEFWDGLKLLWVAPDTLDAFLEELAEIRALKMAPVEGNR